MSSIKNQQSGFTIVELLVTMIVGAIFVTSINLVLTTQVYISQRSRDLIMANAFVEKKVEALRSQGFLTLTNGTTSITSELPTELSAPRSGSVVITTQSTATKKVVINVSYNEQGTTRSLSYTTFIGELGVGQ